MESTIKTMFRAFVLKFVKTFLWGGGEGTPLNGLNYGEDKGLRLKGVLFSGFSLSNGKEFTN